MKDWQQILRENDPGTARMDMEAAARMREIVVRTARTSAPPAMLWPMRLALTAFAGLVLMLSILGTQRPIAVPGEPKTPIMAGSERRQIQFATPGGTRIIWEINPDFRLGETIP